jgi:hypothetical protein
LLHLVNNLAMSIVENEICCQKLRLRSVDSTRAGPEVKEGVIEVQFHLKGLEDLAVEAIAE